MKVTALETIELAEFPFMFWLLRNKFSPAQQASVEVVAA